MPIPLSCTCDRLDRVLGLADAFCPFHGLEQPGLTLTALAADCEASARTARLDARAYFLLAGVCAVCAAIALIVMLSAGSGGGFPGVLGVLSFGGLVFVMARRRNLDAAMLDRAALIGRTVAGQ